MRSPWFGTAWAGIEAASPVLARLPIAMAELPDGIRAAEAFLERLRMGEPQLDGSSERLKMDIGS